MIKKIILLSVVALSPSLIAYNPEEYDLKDVGALYCKSQGQNLEQLSDDQLIALGKQYCDIKNNFEKCTQQQAEMYDQLGRSSDAKIISCKDRWFKYRRQACLENAHNALSTTVVAKTNHQQKAEALEKYRQALEQERQSSAIF